ncbi:hypothetical protein [Capsulimonas corticalis]|uniref:hypothetical protein n=1 Tax=Capsulimonas corticalis TaxID=2219043 RepID=UPI001C3F8921|nr:hypothetical protein [Capsulimonas corticalis]
MARENFKRYWVIFSPDNDRRIGGGDSEIILAAKKAMVAAFDAMADADDLEKDRLWEAVGDAETVMSQETRRTLDEYELRMMGKLRTD